MSTGKEGKKRGILRDTASRFELIRMVVAILIGAAITAVVIFAVSETPLESLRCMFFGPIERVRYLFNVLELMVPLIFTGVAISVVFSAKQFNLAAEGIFFFGGMVAAVTAIALKLPKGTACSRLRAAGSPARRPAGRTARPAEIQMERLGAGHFAHAQLCVLFHVHVCHQKLFSRQERRRHCPPTSLRRRRP